MERRYRSTNINYLSDSVSNGNWTENQVRLGGPATIYGQSGLGFAGVAPPDSVFDIGDPFEVGQLRHFNNPIVANSAAESALLTFALSFTDPAGLTGSFAFTFEIDETLNVPGGGEDIISFPSSFPEQTFDIAGTMYTLELLRFRDISGALISQFISPEETTNSAKLFGQITAASAPVPEPATLLLLGSGPAGLAGFRRRFKRK